MTNLPRTGQKARPATKVCSRIGEVTTAGRSGTLRVAPAGKLYMLAGLNTDIDRFANVDTKEGTTIVIDRVGLPLYPKPGNSSTSGKKKCLLNWNAKEEHPLNTQLPLSKEPMDMKHLELAL